MSSLDSDKHSTLLQLARLVERLAMIFVEKRLAGAVFIDAAPVFDAAWVDSLIYKLIAFNCPSYLVNGISSYFRGRTFEASFQAATSTRRGMRTVVTQVN